MKYFKFSEFTRSETANRLGIDNSIPPKYLSNIVDLVENVLDPLRESYGKPIRVTSGYRCQRLNKAVGGVSNSQHQYGMAADIQGSPGTYSELIKLANIIENLGLEHDQLILEKKSWIHVSFVKGHNRNQNFSL